MKYFLYWFKRLFKKKNNYNPNLEADIAYINYWLKENNPDNKSYDEFCIKNPYGQYGEFDLKNKVHILYKNKNRKFK